ncbi:HAD family hydrolase [Dactylosporangium sp. NPDC049742]|uniref:HAD family hydrolase n=1 Tax=Dactylosporangium sp. NPDC049742 TaxID=3154737 RepID=UPI00343443FE
MLPRFLVFDLFHTLVDGADGERDRVVGEMAEMVGVDPSALRQAYRDTWDERLTRWSVEETIRILAGRLGVTPAEDAVARAAAHRRALARRVLDAAGPATLEALDALRAGGARLALVSNATSEAAEAWPACVLAPRFDVAVFSSVLGVGKPDPRIYLAAADALGADPADCVYVGDGADGELAGATAVGMRVVRTVEHKDTDPTWPGPVIRTLRDLADCPV